MNTLTDPDADKKYDPEHVKAAADRDAEQARFDREFAGMTDPENYNQDGVDPNDSPSAGSGGASPETLRKSEESPAKQRGDQGPASAPSLAQSEKAGDDGNPMGFHAENSKGGKHQASTTSWWTKKKAKTAGIIGGGFATLGLTGGMMGFLAVSSGPAQLVTLDTYLQKPFGHSNQQSSSRAGNALRWYRFAKTGDISETRLGTLSSKVYGNAVQKLADSGVVFEKDPVTGRPTKLIIDQEKLSNTLPELKGVEPNSSEALKIIADKLEIDSYRLSPTSGSTVELDLTKAYATNIHEVNPGNSADYTAKVKYPGTGALRLLTGNAATKLIADEGIFGTVRAWVLRKAFGLPNLFHPMTKAKEAAIQKAADLIRSKEKDKGKSDAEADKIAKAEAPVEVENASKAETAQPFEAEAKSASDAVEESKSGFKSALVKGLTFTGAACIVRDTAGAIAKANQDIVVLPAAAEAARFIAIGEQAKYGGSDTTADQINGAVQGLYDENGQSVFGAKSLQSLADPGSMKSNAPDLPGEYQQAFNGQSTAGNIKKGADDTLGGTSLASTVCSTPAMIIQGAVAIALTVGSEVLSGGAATPAVAGLWTAKFVAQSAISMVVIGAVVHIIEQVAINNQLPQKAFSGPLGGNLLAYGARAASNTASILSGAFSLGGPSGTIGDAATYDAPRSLQTRLFSLEDDHSLYFQVATAYYTSGFNNGGFVSGIASVTSSLSNLTGVFSHTLGMLIPNASAADTYDWGFPQYGIPDSMMNDPNLDNPYDNADQVATLLDSPDGAAYVSKAKACFGTAIAKGSDGKWDVGFDHNVDVTSDDYTTAGCTADSNSDGVNAPDWQRVSMFVFDTNVMKQAACASNVDASQCPSSDGGNATPPATSTTTGADQNGQCIQLDGVDGLNVSNQFTDDTTIIPKVTNIVIHWIDSDPESPEDVKAALASDGTSVQFYVSQSGKVMQLTPCANSRAGHAKNANDFAVGIEIGSPNAESIGDTPPYHQLEDSLINNATEKAQVITLATALAKKFGITNVTVGNQTLYTASDTCAALGLSFPGTCATQAEAAQFGIVGHYQLQNTKSDPGPTYVTQIQQGVKSGLGL